MASIGSPLFERIRSKYVPRGWRLRVWRDPRVVAGLGSVNAAGQCLLDEKIICIAPFVLAWDDPKSSYILLHEVGHIHTWKANSPAWRDEYLAERYAFQSMRNEGLTVSHDLRDHAKEYVAQIAKRDGDFDTLPPDVRKWLGKHGKRNLGS